ncbi:uncharacterized protein LOC119402042 [Rhipicephalus sanguineus]|uniref:uncharacterized protein LOC119402042 n=1 Tax=Rhipicephalus sanguineus TaxID=34632 RepID=UPI001893D9D9|nr:uncharacterized protein LOC119402042 [Rhipicephalus sanguineus]
MQFGILKKHVHVSVMKLLGFIVMILATVRDITGQEWYAAESQPSEYSSAAANRGLKTFCYYIRRVGWQLQYAYYPDGTPCLYRIWPRKVGYCLHGRCTAQVAPIEVPCDGVYRSPGYATSCTYTCTQGYRSFNMPYHNGTPCLNINSYGRRVGAAGLCSQGICKSIYDPTPEEDKLTHPQSLLKCPEREHTGRNILTSCYHYCQRDGFWFTGYFDSKPSSGCNLRNPTPEQPLGWCCRGNCIKKYNCLQ